MYMAARAKPAVYAKPQLNCCAKVSAARFIAPNAKKIKLQIQSAAASEVNSGCTKPRGGVILNSYADPCRQHHQTII
jgi:hypothetical protein